MNFLTMMYLTSGAILQPVEPTLLPVHADTYILDDNRQAILWDSTRIRELPGQWMEFARFHSSLGSGRFDSTKEYFKLDLSRAIVRACPSVQEGPMQEGTEFRYESGLMTERSYYRGGKRYARDAYSYSSGDLAEIASLDSAGDTTGSKRFTYENNLLVEIEELPAQNHNRTQIRHLAPDSIEFERVSGGGTPSGFRHVMVLRNGNPVRQYDYDASGLYGYSNWTYQGSSSIRPLDRRFPHAAEARSPDVDFLGRWRRGDRTATPLIKVRKP